MKNKEIKFLQGNKIDLDVLNIVAFEVNIQQQKVYYLVQERPKEVARYSVSLKKALELGIINLTPLESIHIDRKK